MSMISTGNIPKLVDHKSRVNLPNVVFRASRNGPEDALVDWFLRNCSLDTPEGYRTTIFREPRIHANFPDLVVVSWDENVTRWWPSSRFHLKTEDIRIIHFLSRNGSTTEDEIAALGIPFSNSLVRLEGAGMICKSRLGRWRLAAKINDLFAIRRIVAIEAKTESSVRVLEQAFQNTWFSQFSYVLLPTPPKKRFVERAEKFGLGIISQTTHTASSLPPMAKKISPRSYGSWLFNEWAWKNSLSNCEEIL